MSGTRALAVLAGLVVWPTLATAQHAEAILTEACAACHDSHGTASPGAYNLKAGDVPVWGLAGGGPLEPRSTTCLRCHASEDVRRSQSDVMLGPGSGRYVGLDLAGQHPLGPLDRILGRDALPGDATRRPLFSRFSGREWESVECTSCHDPHQRGAAPLSGMVTSTCLGCHASTPYRLTHAELDCQACHDVHTTDPNRRLLAGPGADSQCRECHVGGGLASGADAGGLRAPEAHPSEPQTAGAPCLGCHGVHT